MTDRRTASQQVIEEVTAWPGVKVRRGAGGELVFTVRGLEIGQLNGDFTETDSGVWEVIGLIRLNYSRVLARLIQTRDTRPERRFDGVID
jgi:hypothetical protein